MGPFRSCVGPSTEAWTRSSSSSPAPPTRIVASSMIRDGISFANGTSVADSTISNSAPAAGANATVPERTGAELSTPPEARSQLASMPARDLNDRLVGDLIDAVKAILRKEASDRLRDVYLIGDIEKDLAR